MQSTEFDEFANSDFDVRQWVNNALDGPRPDDVLVDQYASALVLKLQLALHDTIDELDNIGKQAVGNIPRVLRDIDTVRYDATTLRERLDVVRADIEKVELETGKSIQSISQIDKLKGRMEATSKALQDAQRWDVLVVELERIWQDNNVALVSSKLQEMRRVLQSLACVPDYEARKLILSTGEQRLQDMVAPMLLDAFATQDYDNVICLKAILEETNRSAAVKECYFNCHRPPALSVWGSLIESHPASGGQPGCDIAEVLNKMHDHLLSLLNKEAPWTVRVFGADAQDVQCTMLSQILGSLSPSLSDCLTQSIGSPGGDTSHTPSAALDKLLQLYKISTGFANVLANALRGDAPASQGSVSSLLQQIYGPFVSYQRGYGDVAKRAMLSKLSNTSLTPAGYLDTIRHVSESVPTVFGFLEGARAHCAAAVLAEYLSKLTVTLAYLRNMCDVGDAAGLDGDAAAFQQKSWSYFQGALMLLQSCGELITRSEKFAAQVNITLLGTAEKVVSIGNVDLTAPFNYLHATPRQCAALQATIQMVQKGERETLGNGQKLVFKFNDEVHQLAFDILFSQVQRLLGTVPTMPVWSSGGGVSGMLGVPSFSLTQQTYITQVGQHLLTVPQQLEMMVAGEEGGENQNLRAALSAGTLPYYRKGADIEEEEAGQAHEWLEAVAMGTMETYVKRILEIPKLAPHGAKQLAKDIEYLYNVLNVLDVDPIDELAYMVKMLDAPVQDSQSLVAEATAGPVRAMAEKLAAIRTA